jgi:hypothetical protein
MTRLAILGLWLALGAAILGSCTVRVLGPSCRVFYADTAHTRPDSTICTAP